MPLDPEVDLGQGDFLLDGDPPPLSPKRGRSPQFSANVSWGQTAGFIKMPLGMEVGLSQGDSVLDGTQPPLQKSGGAPPIFGPCLLRPNSCMDQDATWHGAVSYTHLTLPTIYSV